MEKYGKCVVRGNDLFIIRTRLWRVSKSILVFEQGWKSTIEYAGSLQQAAYNRQLTTGSLQIVSAGLSEQVKHIFQPLIQLAISDYRCQYHNNSF